MHENTSLITITMSHSTNRSIGRESRGSNTSFTVEFLVDGDVNDESRSPGCFPINISSATTPKLYTSHFSVTTMV
ncbi:hypothetical protein LguiB_012815 [Lonicera macranthoides]